MGSITGIIRDANNAPLEDVNMVIVSGPSHPDIVALTDSGGRFSFENLQPGDYTLKAYGRVESDDIPVRLFRHKTPFVEVWLEANASEQGENIVDEESYFTDDSQLREGF